MRSGEKVRKRIKVLQIQREGDSVRSSCTLRQCCNLMEGSSNLRSASSDPKSDPSNRDQLPKFHSK